MTKQTIARFAGIAAGAGLALGVFAPVGAQTIAQLQAQIAALMAQLQALQGGTGVTNAISSDLTVGSSGQSVVVLQNALIAQGYLTMPAGVSTGYFGALTKAAVMKWQAANGLPATGFFGAMSRAKFGAGSTTGGTTTGGTTTGGTTGVISTPGAEGTLTVTSAPVSVSTLYEGQSMKDVLAFKAEADLSDIAIQRVKLDLGTDTTLYRDLLTKVYLVDDAGRTLASADLNNTTVVRNSTNEYEVTLAGFSSVVAKDTTRVYTIKADIESSIEAADITEGGTITLADNGVRGIDGAGIDQYSPASDTAVSRALSFSASLTESATLTVSSNTANPLTRELVAAGGANDDEADKVVLMVFDVRAEKDDVTITDILDIVVTRSAGAATASTTYLYAGNGVSGTPLATDTGTGSDIADFTDIDYVIPANTTKTFTLAADIRSANGTQTTIDVTDWTPTSATLVAENSEGDAIASGSISGTLTANDLLVRNVGPEITVGSKTLVRDSGTSGVANGTSTATATFNITLKAVGGPIWFGTQSASSTFGFGIHVDGANASTVLTASSTSWSVPSGVNTSDLASGQAFKLEEDQSVTIPVTFFFNGRLATGSLLTSGSYAVGLSSVAWSETKLGTAESSTFMSNRTEWRTNAVTMP